MNQDPFDTKEKKKDASDSFELLQQNLGWKNLCVLLEINIEYLNKCLLDGLYRDEIPERRVREEDRIRDKILNFKELIRKPQEMIDKFKQEIVSNEVNSDPYYTNEEVSKIIDTGDRKTDNSQNG